MSWFLFCYIDRESVSVAYNVTLEPFKKVHIRSFSRIKTEYGDLESPYSVQMQENTD